MGEAYTPFSDTPEREELIARPRYSVVTTVRSSDKADLIRTTHPGIPNSKLDVVIVEDIAKVGCFDDAVRADPPFDAVIHTASPFTTDVDVADVKEKLLDPAIVGTTELLKAVARYAPQVKRVVLTSSFAAILDGNKGNSYKYTYTEQDWNPITEAEAHASPLQAYRASKTLAERAAWSFMKEKEKGSKPHFTLATICPPLVFGPLKPHQYLLPDLSNLNTSNTRIRNFLRGDYKTDIPDTGASFFVYVDVRDLAWAHVRVMELDDEKMEQDAGEEKENRFFFVSGHFTNRQIADILWEKFPEYRDVLPGKEIGGGGFPEEGVYGVDNGKVVRTLGMDKGKGFRSLEESVVGLVHSLKERGM